jgi:hypothetical protein
MGVAAIAGERRKRLGHETGPQALLFGHRFHHHLEEGMAIGGGQGISEGPVDLELTVGILMVGLVGPPAQLLHGLQQGANQAELTHQRHLVVAGLLLVIGGIGDRGAIGVEQKEFGLDAAAQLVAEGLGALQLVAQQAARTLAHRRTLQHQLGGHPANAALPGAAA